MCLILECCDPSSLYDKKNVAGYTLLIWQPCIIRSVKLMLAAFMCTWRIALESFFELAVLC